MSWDFHMEIDTGGSYPAHVEGGLNYTYNVAPMFYEALPFKDGIRSIDGMTGREALPGLRHGVAAMEDNPKKYLAMNPENGWGDYHGALDLLRKLVTWAAENPKATFRL